MNKILVNIYNFFLNHNLYRVKINTESQYFHVNIFSILDLGFEDFIRVGSVNRIAKPILPYRLV